MILCMRAINSIIILLFFLGANAQKTGTLFVDSVSIEINDTVIFNTFKTYLKFIPIEKSKFVTLFDNGVYKLEYGFSSESDTRIQNHVFSKGDLEIKLMTELLDAFSGNDKEWNCSGLYTERYSLKSLESENNDKVKINLRYRFVNLAPRDTSNYLYNYRHGEWIGSSGDAKEITVNYDNDRKNGQAKVIYNNGAVYKTNFINGYEENYGIGKFENYEFSNYIIPNVVSQTCNPLTSTFYVKKGRGFGNYKKIRQPDVLSVNFSNRGLSNDSLEYNVKGDFIVLTGDTIVIKSNKLIVHDFYKRNVDSSYYSKYLVSGFQKVNINDITLIKRRREVFQNSIITISLLSLVSAIVVSPVASIQKHGFNMERFAKISGTSLGVTTLAVTFGVLFGSEKFLIVNGSKGMNTRNIIPKCD